MRTHTSENNSSQDDLIFPRCLKRRLTLLLIFALPDKLTSAQFQVEVWILSRTGTEGQDVWVKGNVWPRLPGSPSPLSGMPSRTPLLPCRLLQGTRTVCHVAPGGGR